MKIGIVGAGIMGRTLAFYLVNNGWDVTLFDQHQKDDERAILLKKQGIFNGFTRMNSGENFSCSRVAGGLLTPISELDKSEEIIFQLGEAAVNVHWPAIISQLPDPIYFQRTGSLVVAHPHDQAELACFMARISRRFKGDSSSQSHNESAGGMTALKLTQTDITQLEPELTKFQQGYYFPQEGHVDSQSLFYSLGNYLRERKVNWFDSVFVKKVEPFKITLDDAVKKFDRVVDCRGLGAKSLFTDLRGVRGEIIWLYAPDVNISRPIRFLHPRYALYIVPRPGNIYLVGASEIESEDFGYMTVKTALELLTATYYIHPSFAEAQIIQLFTHCRPTLSDHLPRVKAAEGLIAINGLYRHGYLIAPTIANDVLEWFNNGIASVRYPKIWEIQ